MMRCKYCNSEEIIKYGFNQHKHHKTQKYRCQDCKHVFSNPDKLPKHDITSEIMSMTIDAYLNGLSYRVSRRQILEQFNINISHVSIYDWIQDYSDQLKKYTDKLEKKLGAVWQMDETIITFKGKSRGKITIPICYWLWVCIDTKTRYIIHAKLSPDKSLLSGDEFFKEIQNTGVQAPDVICTDGNPTYVQCIKSYYPQAKHLRIKHISVKPDTSFIERFNATIKNRTKTMRGFQQFEACKKTLALFMIYYNFLRPHMALDNATPAQQAGLDLNLQNRWISLIRYAQVANNFQ